MKPSLCAAGALMDMSALAAWVALLTTRREMVVSLRQRVMVQRCSTRSDGFRPRGEVDHLANMAPYGSTSVALIDQPVDEPFKM
ncbi:MAG: hypothetical protein QFF03_18595 [Pseudomonadota bacterium]|nr:hypothetical protein [Pseudomonadota bacterium]